MRTRLCILWTAIACVACSAPLQGEPNTLQIGGVQATAALEARAELDARTTSDATVADWISGHGTPDYVAFPTSRSTILFYVGSDEAVHFQRARFARASQPPNIDRIRAGHHAFFSNADRERLGDLRRSRAVFEERERRRRNWNYGEYGDPEREPSAETPAALDPSDP